MCNMPSCYGKIIMCEVILKLVYTCEKYGLGTKPRNMASLTDQKKLAKHCLPNWSLTGRGVMVIGQNCVQGDIDVPAVANSHILTKPKYDIF